MTDGADRVALQRIELLNDAGRHEEAARAAGVLLAAAPSDVEALVQLGRAQAGRKDYAAMLDVANALTRADPDGFFAHILASEALFHLKDYSRALVAAQEATRRAPDSAVSHRMVAWAASELKGQQRLAWDAANHAVRLGPLDAENHTCAGTLAMEMGDQPLAERALAEALRLDPGDALARHNLAVLRTRQGRLVDATHGLLTSASMDPQQELVPHNLASVILVWLQRTHWGMWGTYLVLRSVAGTSDHFSVPSAVALLLGLGLLAWWTRQTVLRLGGHVRATMWRVLHRSVFTALWFWSLVAAGLALVVAGLGPSAGLRMLATLVSAVALVVGCLSSWIGAVRHRRRVT
mgnify:CR=1 FL=1